MTDPSDSNGNSQHFENTLTLRGGGQRTYELTPEVIGAWPEDRKMTFRDVKRVLRNHAIMILAGTLGLAALVLLWLSRGPDYYEASARVEIGLESESPPPGDTANRDLQLQIDPEYLGTQLQIIRSPMLLQEVIGALKLQNDEIYNRYLTRRGQLLREVLRLTWIGKHDRDLEREPDQGVLTPSLHSSSTEQQMTEAKQLEPYITDLQKRLTIEPVKETNTALKETRIITIRVKHPSRVLATRLANAIADAYVYSNEERKAEAGKATNDYLQRRVTELQTDIRSKEDQLASYGSQHDILSLDPGQNTTLDRLASLERQLTEAEDARLTAQANFTTASGPNGSTILADDAEKEILAAQSRLEELQEKRAQLLVGATEKFPEVQEVEQQIAAAQQSVDDLRKQGQAAALNDLETKYHEAQAHEDALRKEFDEQRKAMKQQDEAAVEYRLLQQQIETGKYLVNEYLHQLGANDVAQAAIVNNVSIVDYATLPNPGDAAGPWRLLFALLAAAIGLSITVSMAFVFDAIDDTFRCGEDIREALQLPVLGLIPAASSRKALNGNGRRKPVALLFSRQDTPNLALPDSETLPAVAHAYRRAIASLLMSSGRRPKSYLVTSSVPGEGKSTTAANLGIYLAQASVPVVVIDADPQKRGLSTLLGMKDTPGLQDWLLADAQARTRGEHADATDPKVPAAQSQRGEVPTTDQAGKTGNGNGAAKLLDPFAYLQRHAQSGVYVLAAGNGVFDSHHIPDAEVMLRLLKTLQSKFAMVVIDSPALSGSIDTMILSRAVDEVVLVVENGKVPREIVQRSRKLLEEAGAEVCGVVLTKVDGAQGWQNYPYGTRSGTKKLPTGASA